MFELLSVRVCVCENTSLDIRDGGRDVLPSWLNINSVGSEGGELKKKPCQTKCMMTDDETVI